VSGRKCPPDDRSVAAHVAPSLSHAPVASPKQAEAISADSSQHETLTSHLKVGVYAHSACPPKFRLAFMQRFGIRAKE